ncbi:MAG: IS3 family transposase, partial [Planctomycetes bacterium]|nr:IS3 family transposase [Planctomycetota bacterium]
MSAGTTCRWRTPSPASSKEVVHGEDYTTRAEAKANIFEYIEAFYNRARRHSS